MCHIKYIYYLIPEKDLVLKGTINSMKREARLWEFIPNYMYVTKDS